MALLPLLEAFAERWGVLRPEQRVVAAVSGGPDSVALLHALLRLSRRRRFKLHGAHVDHGLREDSRDDAQFVRSLCAEWGVEATVVRVDVAASRRGGESVQQAARRLRLGALRRIARETGAAGIAFGHHLDDQAETVLLRLLRGAGTTGLAAMRPVRGPFLRPLLGARRSDIEAYVEEHGLIVRRDVSNLSDAYVRNRIRLGLLPLLEAHYNPNVVESLARTASVLQADDELLRALADDVYESVLLRAGAGRSGSGRSGVEPVVLAADVLASEPEALRRRVVRRALKEAGADLRLVTYDHTEAVLGLLDDSEAGALTLPGNLRVERSGSHLVFGGPVRGSGGSGAGALRMDTTSGSGVVVVSGPFAEAPLEVPGRTAVGSGLIFTAKFVSPSSAAVPDSDSDGEVLLPAVSDPDSDAGASSPPAVDSTSATPDSTSAAPDSTSTAPGPGLGIPDSSQEETASGADLHTIHSSGRSSPATSEPHSQEKHVLAEVFLDAVSLRLPLLVRPRRPGDRIRPVGLGGSKKVQDLFVDERVPRDVRDRVPLVLDQDGIVWIPGLRIDERAAAKRHSRNILHLRLESL